MKSKKFFMITALLLLSLVLMACSIPVIKVVKGTGSLTTETREVGDFDSIQLNGTGKLVITQGESVALQIEAEDNILPYLESSVIGNTLQLGFHDNFWQRTLLPTEPITYSLVVTDLNALTFNGAGSLDMNQLATDELSITVNGASQIKIKDLKADSLSIQINGTGNVGVAGEVTTQTVSIDGAGTVLNGDLKSSQANITANGLGIATVWATDHLDVTINGGGTLNYYGEPTISQNINGAADINHLGNK